MVPQSILVVEDDATMRRVLKDNLEYKGYSVITAADGESGLKAAVERRPDLMLLDIMLPGINGYEICRLVREAGGQMPIIMLTAKGQESDIVLGLNLGADDFVTKPFSLRVLLARVEAFLRRRRVEQEEVLRFGDYRLDPGSHRLLCEEREVPLTPKEFGVLSYMARHPGRAMTRDQILRAVWGHSVLVTDRSIDRCVNTLRSKIEPDPQTPIYLHTIHGIGYRFEPPD
jgi:DNA-binding response OmpR family regulator